MNSVINFILGCFVIIIILSHLAESLFGTKCPVCGSTSHWIRRYWGENRDYDDEYCSNAEDRYVTLRPGKLKPSVNPRIGYKINPKKGPERNTLLLRSMLLFYDFLIKFLF